MGDPVGICISQASFKRYDMIIIDIYHLNVSIVTCHDDYINLEILVLLICRLCFYGLFLALKIIMIDLACHGDYINLLCFYGLVFPLKN